MSSAVQPEAILNRAQTRILVRRALERLFRFGLIFSTALVVAASFHRLFAGTLPPVSWGWWALGTFLAGWIVWTAAVFPRRLEVARKLDRLAAFKDRFVTYLEFSGAKTQSAYQELALAQNSEEIARLNVARWCPIRMPRRAVWLIAPAICFLNLLLLDHFSRQPLIRDPALEQALAAKSEELKNLAEDLKKAAEERKLAELVKVAAEMRKAAEQIKPQQGKSAEEMRKTALLEWSRLEAKLSELSKLPPPGASAEMRDLASALEQDAATAELAKMLKQGDLAGAMQELGAMMKQAQSDPAAQQQLREMAERMSQVQMSSEQMAEMMKQMRAAAAAGEKSETHKAMQTFSQMLANMEGNRQQSKMAASGLSALQMMKEGMSSGQPGALGMKGDKGDQEGDAPGKGKGDANQEEGKGIGTEAAENIFGEKSRIDATKATAKVEGQVGEGRSFESILRGTAEQTTSTVEYRELFNNYTPEAEEAIYQENIPLGSKYYIKRYFESIRPQD